MSGGLSAGVLVGLGWLDGTARTPEPEEVIEIMRERFGKPINDLPPSGFYGKVIGFDRARVRVEWNGRAMAAGTTRAEVKQSALDTLGLAGGVDLVRALGGVGYRPSRVDLWMDDEGRRITPGKVRAAVLGGQAITHARPGRHWTDDWDGRETYYLGRAGSDRMVRVYDKLDPERTRTELQARRDAALGAARALVGSDRPSSAVVGQLLSFVDFRESHGRSDGRRAPRLDWWAAVVGDAARAEAAPSRPRPSVEEVAAYLMEAWSRKFAEVYRVMGPEWLAEFLRVGSARLDREARFGEEESAA